MLMRRAKAYSSSGSVV